jgi:hypothetical protein
MARSEELRRQASRLLLVAKKTKDPLIAASCSVQAGELLDQAHELEALSPQKQNDSEE